MTIQPKDIFIFAKNCFEQAEAEVDLRCSISRMYYSLFHELLLLLDYYSYPKNNHHIALINYLITGSKYENLEKVVQKRIGLMLNNLRALRNISDYDLEHTISKSDAQAAFIMAEKILNMCHKKA